MLSVHLKTTPINVSCPPNKDNQRVRWQCFNGEQFMDYDVDINKAIEKAFQRGEPTYSLSPLLVIDFKTNTVQRTDCTNRGKRIRRYIDPTIPQASPVPPPSEDNTPTNPLKKVTKLNFLHYVNIPVTTTTPNNHVSFVPRAVNSRLNPVINNSHTPSRVKQTGPQPEQNDIDEIDIDEILKLCESEEVQQKKSDSSDTSLIHSFKSVKSINRFIVRPVIGSQPEKNNNEKFLTSNYINVIGTIDKSLKEQCERYGAEFRTENTVTNIIVYINGTITKDTITYCALKGIPIVSKDWIVESLKSKKRLPTEQYELTSEELHETADLKRTIKQHLDLLNQNTKNTSSHEECIILNNIC